MTENLSVEAIRREVEGQPKTTHALMVQREIQRAEDLWRRARSLVDDYRELDWMLREAKTGAWGADPTKVIARLRVVARQFSDIIDRVARAREEVARVQEAARVQRLADGERVVAVACNSILDRGYGKPRDINPDEEAERPIVDIDKLSPERRELLLALFRFGAVKVGGE